MLAALWNKIANEPVAITAFIIAFIDLAVVFGLPLSPEQKGAIITVVDSLLVLVARQLVTPTRKLKGSK